MESRCQILHTTFLHYFYNTDNSFTHSENPPLKPHFVLLIHVRNPHLLTLEIPIYSPQRVHTSHQKRTLPKHPIQLSSLQISERLPYKPQNAISSNPKPQTSKNAICAHQVACTSHQKAFSIHCQRPKLQNSETPLDTPLSAFPKDLRDSLYYLQRIFPSNYSMFFILKSKILHGLGR